jgi:poly-gamma-glutamate synthesis protein (capsule biosynthesis protein)
MKIALLGDMAFFGRYSVCNGGRVYNYFKNIAEHLSSFDYVIGNLETPLCRGLRPRGAKSAYINADVENVRLLKFLNMSAVNLANNHIFDFGREDVDQTISALATSDIDYFGVDGKGLLLNDNGARVALNGYCSFNTNPLGASRKSGVGLNVLNIERVREELLKNHQNQYLNILSIHSGREHVNYPSLDDIEMARGFSQICPYVYYGHHPHVMQGYESIGESLIAYSLGNFCFDDVYTDKSSEPLVKQSDNNKTGMIVELEVHGKRLVHHLIRTIYAGADSLILDPEGASDLLTKYCDGLIDEVELYSARRESLISKYLSERRNMRDLAWYLKRLNPNSIGIILRSMHNQFLYKKHVSRYLG